MKARRAASFTALLLLLAACGPSPEAVERDRVARSIDALRDAPSDALEQRRKLLEDLERQPTSFPPAERAKRDCAAAYRLLLDGTALEKKVEAALHKDEPPTAAVARDLIDAEAKIRKSAALMPDCQGSLAELRRPARR